jgi:phage major head subunit gpT-like protein
MPALTPQYLTDLESRMRLISNTEYNRLVAKLWYSSITKHMPSTGKRERLIWLLDTAKIQYVNRLGGEVEFEDLLSNTFEFENKAATGGFELNRFQLEDHDGGGVQLATQWSRQIGVYAAYWPQKQVGTALRLGGAATSLGYDLLPFFSTAHPVNPFDSSAGVYANDFTGAASGAYPGACPIDASVPLDTAFNNLQKVFTYIRSLKMPNGEDPRMLRAAGLIVPPALSMRAQQLTNAKLIAQAAGGGGAASADVEAVVRNWGIGQPIEADELGAGMPSGSDTSFYVVAEQLAGDEMGAIIYSDREPFQIVFNGEMTDAQLARANKLQWLTRGRNTVQYGHPYLLFRVRAT